MCMIIEFYTRMLHKFSWDNLISPKDYFQVEERTNARLTAPCAEHV